MASSRWPPQTPQEPEGPPRAPNQQWWAQEPGGPRPGLQRRRDGPEDPRQGPPGGHRLLGLLKSRNDPHFTYVEHKFRVWVQEKLTADWKTIQCGHDARAKALWVEIFQHLELDAKAIRDLLLLAHMGVAGRAEANEILWTLLSVWALKREYLDLSHKCSNLVGEARQAIERPPPSHKDRASWRWQRYWVPRHERFSPANGPRGAFEVVAGPGGVPLEPPRCWKAI